MFRLHLTCSCSVDLIPGNLPLFIGSLDCDLDHSHLNPYNGIPVNHINVLDNLDVIADALMMQSEGMELCGDVVWN